MNRRRAYLLIGYESTRVPLAGFQHAACVMAPALLLPHLTLVVSPLLALMKGSAGFFAQQADCRRLDRLPEQSQQVMQAVREGQLKVLMITVERLKNERFR